jgi:5-(carboxyamino)imidazole ribonucleotide mutase
MPVCVVLGSASDRPAYDKCREVLDRFGVASEVHIASAHRTPDKVAELVRGCDADVFIAIAGLSAALPGAVAAHTVKPVIGVPLNAKLEGVDALLSIMQMPPGVPAACVGIDRAENAALLAVEILALKDAGLRQKLEAYRAEMRQKVEKDDAAAKSWK